MNDNDSIRSKKIRLVEEYLLNILVTLPCGGKLPGIRSIRKHTQTGQVTVTHALQNLEKKKILKIEPGRGVFRIKAPENPREIRLLHWADNLNRGGFASQMFQSLEKEASQSGWTIVAQHVGDRTREQICEELIDQGISYCIIYGSRYSDFTSYLCQNTKLCMELLPRHMERVTTELRDSPDMTRMQIDYLLMRGYRRIGYIHYGGNDLYCYPVQIMRLLDYYRLMAEHHLVVDPFWVYHCQEVVDEKDMERGMDQIWNTDPRPEVLIVSVNAAAQYVFDYCRKHKIRVGKDLALFCCDDMRRKNLDDATTITNNPAEIAQTFWQMFLAVERGEKVESTCTKLFIRSGKTVLKLENR